MKRLLTRDVRQRVTAAEALLHPFITGNDEGCGDEYDDRYDDDNYDNDYDMMMIVYLIGCNHDYLVLSLR